MNQCAERLDGRLLQRYEEPRQDRRAVRRASCDQFLKSPQERKDVLSAWMGGYYSAMKNLAKIDARYVVRNSQKIANYCRRAKNETLMSAIQRNWR
jgi:hypothetical protein